VTQTARRPISSQVPSTRAPPFLRVLAQHVERADEQRAARHRQLEPAGRERQARQLTSGGAQGR
jgi:hypothetical protein